MNDHQRNIRLLEAGATGADLLAANLGLCYALAESHLRRLPNANELRDDTKQAAAEGWLRAFRNRDWNPEEGSLATFVKDHIRNTIQQTVDAKQRQGIALPKRLPALGQASTAAPNLVSMDKPARTSSGDLMDWSQLIEDAGSSYDIDDVIDRLDREAEIAKVYAAIGRIPRNYRELILSYLKHGSMRPVAQELGKSSTTVSNKLAVAQNLVLMELGRPPVMPTAEGPRDTWLQYIAKVKEAAEAQEDRS